MSPKLRDHPQCQKPNHENRHKPSLYLSSMLLPENFQKGFASLSHFTSFSPTWGIECGVSPIWGVSLKNPPPAALSPVVKTAQCQTGQASCSRPHQDSG